MHRHSSKQSGSSGIHVECLLATRLDTCRAQSMNNCAAGMRARSFSVTTALRRHIDREALEPNTVGAEIEHGGWITTNRPAERQRMWHLNRTGWLDLRTGERVENKSGPVQFLFGEFWHAVESDWSLANRCARVGCSCL